MVVWRTVAVVALVGAFALEASGRGGGHDESLGDKLKKMFASPTPTPRKHHKKSNTEKSSPTPTPTPAAEGSPSATPAPTAGSPAPSATPAAARHSRSAAPSPTPSPAPSSPTPSPTDSELPRQRSRPHTAITEPVRPIEPGPHSRKRVKQPPAGTSIPSPTPSRTPPPSPTPPPNESPEPPKPPETAAPSASPPPPRKPTAPATVSPKEVVGYENYPPSVRRVLDLSLGLTTQNLDYKYGSADPKNGGMDCSGFVYYVLSQLGVKDPPRDAREQYIWVRKAGLFQAVLAHHDDTFELNDLKPGDLLFWAGTYHVDRDPAITHTMIYLGRERGTNQRIMVGASDGRTYKGQQKWGVSVFDFKMPRPKTDDNSGPVFVGYGHIPGVTDRGE